MASTVDQMATPAKQTAASLSPNAHAASHPSPGSALASSPLLAPDSGLDNVRASTVSSLRFSRDLAEIRKLTGGSSHEDDAMFNPDETESNLDMDEMASGDEGNENEKSASKEDLEAVTYSTLSKRADFILANAKRKLNLLEGNLGRARHSLLASPQNTTELRTQSSLASYAHMSPLDEDGSVRIAPRFNFTPPRPDRPASAIPRKTGSGHNRMYSDTSVPSPGGMAIKGSRSLDHMNNKDELQTHGSQGEGEGAGEGEGLEETDENSFDPDTLESVAEDGEAEQGQSMNALRELYGAGSPISKSTQDLRDQAEELRSRIAFLQKRSQDDTPRDTHVASNSVAEQNERAFQSQVNALQRSLEDQERVIEELEAAERKAAAIENDPRGEWHQVLSRNENRDDEFSDDEYFEYDDEYEDGEVPDALADEDLDETKSMAGAHEDREDAFDYEHFILHSGMVFPHTRASSSGSSGRSDGSAKSAGSQSTERGDAANARDGLTGEGQEQWDEYQQPDGNASMASLATTQTTQSFETANEANDSSSDVGSEASDAHNESLLNPGLGSRWPMPPAGGGEAGAAAARPTLSRGESDVPTPTAGAFPREGDERDTQQNSRPISNIISSLMLRENVSGDSHSLPQQDVNLVRSTVEVFRNVCQDLGSKETTSTDMKSLRERLEIAKRVLMGEL